MKEEDKERIVEDDSLNRGDEEGAAGGSSSEERPISTAQLKLESLNDDDVRGVRIILGIGIVVAVLSAVALGIAYAAGVKQVKVTGSVTSGSALCADMGSDILKADGSAVDATITTLLCSGLVNMHSSGIGGGGYMMIRDHKLNRSMAIDFNPSAPSAATPGNYTSQEQLIHGPMAVAVPGEIAGLQLAHKYYGTLPWKDLIKPVSKLARSGFKITEDLRALIDPGFHRFTKNSKLSGLLLDDNGQPKEVGTVIKRPDYADALDLIAEDPRNFYTSAISEDIVATLNGSMTSDDLSVYQALAADIVRMNYNGFTLETPSSPAGGVILFHILKIIEGYKFTPNDKQSNLMYHRVVEAMKFGFAAYPDNVDFSNYESRHNFTNNILGEGHCAELRQKITDNTTHDASYYDPHYDGVTEDGNFVPITQEGSAVAAIDDNELFVSAVSSLNGNFGSYLTTKKYGIILNNAMKAFDHESVDKSLRTLRSNPDNGVAGGRRATSSMAPTVFYNSTSGCGKRGAVGGGGGLKIIPATVQYILDVLSFDIDSTETIERRRLQHTLIPNKVFVEDDFPGEVTSSLRARDHNTTSLDNDKHLGSISASYKLAKVLYGKGDTRKNGKTVIFEV